MASASLFPKNVCDPADLPAGFLDFLKPLHENFSPWQRELANRRKDLLIQAVRNPPDHDRSEGPSSHRDEWYIEVPEWCADQRNQMTGPADDAELVVKMLNSGAPGVMIDLEDSIVNTWEHTKLGVANAVKALHGELTYTNKKGDTVGIAPSGTVVFTRVRGLHMHQHGVFGAEPVAASLFDTALLVYQLDPSRLKHPICIYIPKSESALEAVWWCDLFTALAAEKGLPEDAIKCMALVESHPLAYQMEEFLYHLRHHILGLNLGRWDYMASLLHHTLHDPKWVLPDRNTIPHDVPFFQRLRQLMVEVCHSRGALAVGGMTALYPSRTDSALNARALEVLERDKKNEAAVGMDGAWTGHPDQNAIAVAQFPAPNQLSRMGEMSDTLSDLRPPPIGVGKITYAGTCEAVRTVIRYRYGVLCGKGASLIDGYMEDLATDRIYRLMLAQRVRHQVIYPDFFPELLKDIFDRQFLLIIWDLPYEDPNSHDEARRYAEAARISLAMILNGDFDPT